MLENDPTSADPTGASTDNPSGDASTTAPPRPRRRRAASRPAGPPPVDATSGTSPAPTATATNDATAPAAADASAPAAAPAAEKPTRVRRPRAKATAAVPPAAQPDASTDTASAEAGEQTPATPPVKTVRKRAARKKAVAEPDTTVAEPAVSEPAAAEPALTEPAAVTFQPPVPLFQPPEVPAEPDDTAHAVAGPEVPAHAAEQAGPPADADAAEGTAAAGETEAPRSRRRRGGRGRRRGSASDTPTDAPADTATDSAAGVTDGAAPTQASAEATSFAATPSAPAGAEPADHAAAAADADQPDGGEQPSSSGRRRRRRRRSGSADEPVAPAPDDPPNTVVKVRAPRKRAEKADKADRDGEGDVQSVKGSTRLEAKKQRRRDGRDQGRRRAPVITEAEFLARREAVDRVMAVRQTGDRLQIAVLEDGVLVEHYVTQASSTSYAGNVYLGRVQNVLPSMEAAFVDIGKGRNAVLYAGEVNFDAAGLEGQPRRIELALKSGQSVLVQVTKDPIAHKGARLTSQISLPGRFLVYVPESSMTGISRKLPDTERSRLKSILKKVLPEGAGVIVRTAAEGASEEELSRDVARLTAQWDDIQRKAQTATAPALVYGEPDLAIRVVRDIFNEDFTSLVVSGQDAWDTLEAYVGHVAPDLVNRLSRWTEERDLFTAYRIDEQLAKALDRKVWLPSGGSIVIDRTEAMVVVDVNTGKFTGKGGNLEETVTKNNLEAAEEVVRQLRLRDLGGIIVIDFIDMVLESNRELVLRRLLECLGRDRTKHQVAEVTSLGLVQMTRKRVGQGLLEAFSEPCESCGGRGLHIRMDPAAAKAEGNGGRRAGPKPLPRPPATAPAPVPSAVPVVGEVQGDAEAAEPRSADAHGSIAEVLEPDVEPIDSLDGGAPTDVPAEAPNGEAPASAPARPTRARKRTAKSAT